MAKDSKRTRRVYTPEEIGEVVSRLLAGDTERFIVKETGIPQSTISGWKKRYIIDGEIIQPYQRFPPSGTGFPPAPSKETITELILINLQKELEVKNAMLDRVLNDPDWLREQTAETLAIFYGIISDKNDRTLQRITEANV